MKIIGITGTIGAGKGTVVEYLVGRYGFKHYSVRQYLTRELNREGKEINRDNFTELANRLRAEHSPSYIVEELYKEAKKSGEPSIIESIRTVGEVEMLQKESDFYLLAIDADIQTRYERIVERKSETDRVSFEKFKADEAREMTSSDPNKQNIEACIQLADYKIINNHGVETLKLEVDRFVEKINLTLDEQL